jgi:hypothetical protein
LALMFMSCAISALLTLGLFSCNTSAAQERLRFCQKGLPGGRFVPAKRAERSSMPAVR